MDTPEWLTDFYLDFLIFSFSSPIRSIRLNLILLIFHFTQFLLSFVSPTRENWGLLFSS